MYTEIPSQKGSGLQPYATPKAALEWNAQTVTFVGSIVAQAVAMGLTIWALAESLSGSSGTGKPPLLEAVLVLELVVQVVELVWYLVVGALYYFRKMSIGVEYRYWDWAVTTPAMLISILLFVWYLQCDLLTVDNLLQDTSKVAAVATVVVLDWIMLLIGYAYEARWTSVTNLLDFGGGSGSGLLLGFIPFVGSFVPIFVSVYAKPDAVSWFVSILTFCIWLLYGVVAVVYARPQDAMLKNTYYNILDVVSKNAAGITVSIVALLYTPTAIDTTVALCNVTST